MDFIKKYKVRIVTIVVALLTMLGMEVQGELITKIIDFIIKLF